jgi:hypothetical protein
VLVVGLQSFRLLAVPLTVCCVLNHAKRRAAEAKVFVHFDFDSLDALGIAPRLCRSARCDAVR